MLSVSVWVSPLLSLTALLLLMVLDALLLSEVDEFVPLVLVGSTAPIAPNTPPAATATGVIAGNAAAATGAITGKASAAAPNTAPHPNAAFPQPDFSEIPSFVPSVFEVERPVVIDEPVVVVVP